MKSPYPGLCIAGAIDLSLLAAGTDLAGGLLVLGAQVIGSNQRQDSLK